jgi:hypothetical protein
MKMNSLFSRFWRRALPCRAAIMLIALAWSRLAFCVEIHDAARNGDLEEVKTLLKDNPDFVYSKDNTRTIIG